MSNTVPQQYSAIAWYTVPGDCSVSRSEFLSRLAATGNRDLINQAPRDRAKSDAIRMAIRNLTDTTIEAGGVVGRIVSADVKGIDVKVDGWAWDLHLRDQNGVVEYTRIARIRLDPFGTIHPEHNPDGKQLPFELANVLEQGIGMVPDWTKFYQDSLDASQLRSFLGGALNKVKFPIKNGVFWVLGRNLDFVKEVAGLLANLDSGTVSFSNYILEHTDENKQTLAQDLSASIDDTLTAIQDKLAAQAKMGKAELTEAFEYVEDLRMSLGEFQGILGTSIVLPARVDSVRDQVETELKNWKRGTK